MMLERIRELPQMGRDALRESINLPREYRGVSNVIISGMGGSGIAGDVVRDLMEDVLPKSIAICKRLTLPAFANENTLVMSLSYSGNTIETISALEDALSKRCKIIGITSGGRMEELFLKNEIPYAKLSSGYLPREAMPYMLFLILNIFSDLGWIEDDFSIDELDAERKKIESVAKQVAKRLQRKMVIIYTKYPSVAHRFKSQLNENSKTVAKYDIITELCHNEINSWTNLGNDLHIIFLRDLEEPRVVSRMVGIIKKLLKSSQYTQIAAKGRTKLNRILYLIWMGDFISYYLAVENRVNPERVHATEFLKAGLSRFSNPEL